MDLIKKIIIKNPPTKWVKPVKYRKKGSKKKGLKDVHYLTANLWYSNDVHFTTQSDIRNDCKGFLYEHLQGIPKLNKMRTRIVYSRTTDDWDLDNKAFFWRKLLLDLLKTPSSKEVLKARRYNKEILSLRVVPDDSCKYIDENSEKYIKGEHALIIEIYGRLEDEQQQLF